MDEQPKENKQPKPEEKHFATVQESADLLKKLAEFNSKKEEMLKRLSSISERMEKRMAERDSLDGQVKMPDFLKTEPIATPAMAEPLKKLAFTRIRETNKPVFVQGCFNVYMPNKQAITEEWIKTAKDGLEATFTVDDDGITLAPGCEMRIPTGLKLGVPQNLALHFMSRKGLSVTFPTLLTSMSNEQELVISVLNDTVSDMKILFGIPLFTGHLIQLQTNITCEELLNSTYDDWVHGTING